eukprot:7774301-Alexandrium_andersonii.AAC.1
MSASLVGSEMCIRDRDSELAVTCCKPPHALSPRMVPAGTCGPVRCSMIAVSYTHLTLPTICSV